VKITHPSPILLILLFAACSASTGVKQCGPEERVVRVRGQLPIGNGTAFAGLGLSEVREPGRPETEIATIDVFAQSDSLRTHMTRAELRDTQSPSRLFGTYTPPLVLPLPPNLFSFDGPYAVQLPVEDFRSLMAAGQLVLEIQTDLAAQPLVRIPLNIIVQIDPTWIREQGEGCG
jgi:hypothetical protein